MIVDDECVVGNGHRREVVPRLPREAGFAASRGDAMAEETAFGMGRRGIRLCGSNVGEPVAGTAGFATPFRDHCEAEAEQLRAGGRLVAVPRKRWALSTADDELTCSASGARNFDRL